MGYIIQKRIRNVREDKDTNGDNARQCDRQKMIRKARKARWTDQREEEGRCAGKRESENRIHTEKVEVKKGRRISLRRAGREGKIERQTRQVITDGCRYDDEEEDDLFV